MLGFLGKAGGTMGKLGTLLKPVAPLLGAAVGGPAGSIATGMAMKALGKVLNIDPGDHSSILSGLESLTAEQLAQIKIEEKKIDAELKKAGFDLRKVEIQDVQDARRVHKESWIPATVTLLLVCSFVVGLIAPLWMEDVDSEVVENILLGIGPLAGSSVSYWLGSSRTQDRVTEKQSGTV